MNRRGFLRVGAALAVAVVAAPSLLIPKLANATVNGGRLLCLGDSRTTFGGWQIPLITNLNAAQSTLPTWNYRTNTEAILDWSVSVLGANAAQYLSDSSCSLAFPTDVLINLGEHDMVAGTVNQTNFQNSFLALIDAINAKWFSAKIYLDFPWAVPVDSQYTAVKGYIQNVIAARSAFCFAGVDQGVVLKGSDMGASETQDGIHFNTVTATCNAYAAAHRTNILGF